MQYTLRNWPYYTWLSGDHIVEQAVHCIDMMSWAMGGKLPVSALGTGGRQVRTEPRSEEHTSELQSLMRISYAVFCLKKKKQIQNTKQQNTEQIICNQRNQ